MFTIRLLWGKAIRGEIKLRQAFFITHSLDALSFFLCAVRKIELNYFIFFHVSLLVDWLSRKGKTIYMLNSFRSCMHEFGNNKEKTSISSETKELEVA